MFDFASSVKVFAARSCSFDTLQKQIETQTHDAALPWASMTRLHENGFLADTMILTEQGWRPAGRIARGDRVMTFDHGYKNVLDVQTTQIDSKIIPDRKATLMEIPEGALGNRAPLQVLPMQHLVIELDKAEALYGDPFVPVPAYMLEGFRGIRKVRFHEKITVVMIGTAREEILHGDGGLLAISNTASELSPMAAIDQTGEERYPRLSQIEIRRLIKTCKRAAHAAFTADSIEDTYAALERRLA